MGDRRNMHVGEGTNMRIVGNRTNLRTPLRFAAVASWIAAAACALAGCGGGFSGAPADVDASIGDATEEQIVIVIPEGGAST
jgi:hypothetical protein